MAHDPVLATRFRDALGPREGVGEKRMMGGVCFLLNGNMIGGADRTKTGQGRFLFRVGKENDEAALARPGATGMVQGGRRMRGFVFVAEDDCDDAMLRDWVAFALEFVATLPPK